MTHNFLLYSVRLSSHTTGHTLPTCTVQGQESPCPLSDVSFQGPKLAATQQTWRPPAFTGRGTQMRPGPPSAQWQSVQMDSACHQTLGSRSSQGQGRGNKYDNVIASSFRHIHNIVTASARGWRSVTATRSYTRCQHATTVGPVMVKGHAQLAITRSKERFAVCGNAHRRVASTQVWSIQRECRVRMK